MIQLRSILVPTDLSGHSRRGIQTACDMHALSIYSEFLEYQRSNYQVWPLDRILNEAHVNLNRFLNPLLAQLERVGSIEKKSSSVPLPSKSQESRKSQEAT